MIADTKAKQRQNQEIVGESILDDYENDDDFVEYENANEATAIQLLKQHNGTNKNQKNGSTQRWRPSYGVNGSDNRQDFHSILLPSYSTKAELSTLPLGETYVVEVIFNIVLIFKLLSCFTILTVSVNLNFFSYKK